jgi:chemotaxis protein MotB
MERLKQKLQEEIQSKLQLQKLAKQIEITMTAEGLRIELLEDRNGTFYQSGSARLSADGQELLALLAAELKVLPNQLLIEGHTDAAQYSSDANYGNWELSADRANAARRLLQQDGVRADQVTQVRGYADQLLRVKNNPYDPSNRRITILVKNTDNGAAPPTIKNAAVVGGGPQGSGSSAASAQKPEAGKTQNAAPSQETAKPSEASAAHPQSTAAAPVKSSPAANSVEAKPTSSPSAPVSAAKTGIWGRLSSILPGGKKK